MGGGEYAARQCHGSTGYCWCVDTANVRISERFRAWEEESEVDCTALRQEKQGGRAGLGRTADEAEPDTEDKNDEKLGLLGMLAFASFVVLPVALIRTSADVRTARPCWEQDELGRRRQRRTRQRR